VRARKISNIQEEEGEEGKNANSEFDEEWKEKKKTEEEKDEQTNRSMQWTNSRRLPFVQYV